MVSVVNAVPAGLVFEQLGSLGPRAAGALGPPAERRSAPPSSPNTSPTSTYVVYPKGTEGRSYAEHALAQAGIELRAAAEATSASAMRALVRAGFAPAFIPALGKRPRRKTNPDGTVAFDLTDMLQELAGLPGFGLLRRAGEPTGLVAAFLEVARAEVA